jgi:hypothetical protein
MLYTTVPASLTRERPGDGFRGLILRLNGAFLLVASSTGVTAEILSHFWGVGPWSRLFRDSPYTIGFFEAHGLALVISLLLLRMAASNLRPWWHLFAAAAEVVLGGANLLFWETFVAFDKVPLGVVTTALHFTFVGAHLLCYARAASTGMVAHRSGRTERNRSDTVDVGRAQRTAAL